MFTTRDVVTALRWVHGEVLLLQNIMKARVSALFSPDVLILLDWSCLAQPLLSLFGSRSGGGEEAEFDKRN